MLTVRRPSVSRQVEEYKIYLSNDEEVAAISQDEVIKILLKHGWADTGRGKGSHKTFISVDMKKVTTVPKRKDLSKGTLRAIRKQTGIDEIK